MRSRRERFYIYARVAFWNWHARAKFLLIRWGKVNGEYGGFGFPRLRMPFAHAV